MKRRTRIRVTADGAAGFFRRAREHAAKLDRGEATAREITINFADVADMLRVLSAERVRLLRVANKAVPVGDLAAGLKRDARAVSRDVDLLESFGLLRTRYAANPGHGRRRIVEPQAAKYQLSATI